jgi:hypothetical protein
MLPLIQPKGVTVMYGAVFTLRPKPGQVQTVEERFHRWDHERRQKVSGAFGGYLFNSTSHPGELVAVAVFDSKESYDKNANDQLEADPVWNDGDVIALGGSHEH